MAAGNAATAGPQRTDEASPDLVHPPPQPDDVAVDRPRRQPRGPGPPVPGERPVVEREPEHRQVLVDPRDLGQPLEPPAEVVAEEAHEATGERRARLIAGSVGRATVQPRQHRPCLGERIGAVGRCVDHRDRIGGQVAPAAGSPGTRALEQREPWEVAERLGRVHRRDAVERGQPDARRGAGGSLRGMGSRRVEHAAMIWGPSAHRRCTVMGGNVPARQLGIRIGRLDAGPNDAITDVRGVRVGPHHADRGPRADGRRPRARSAPASP